MSSTTQLLLPTVKEALNHHPEQIAQLAEELHPADMADIVNELETAEAKTFLRALNEETVTAVLEHVKQEKQIHLFSSIAQRSTSRALLIAEAMSPDDAADMFGILPARLRMQLLADMTKSAPDQARDIKKLLSYEEDSCGGLMTTAFVALQADMSISESIDHVRNNAEEMETVYQAYAVDPKGTLLGVISLSDLVTARAGRSIDTILNPYVITVEASQDQEIAAQTMAKYDLLSLPVVDKNHKIIGIITIDDVLDVVEEEATEDAQKMGAIDPLEAPYMDASIWELVRARAPWLIALFLAGIATASVLESYHDASLLPAMVVWFLPLIISSGGNSGSQSATLVIRAMALGKATASDATKVLAREVAVGAILGLLLAAVGVARIGLTETTRSGAMMLVMGGAVFVVVVVGALVGSGIPFLLQKLKVDPAVSSTPFIASVLDVAGLVIYFEIASLFL